MKKVSFTLSAKQASGTGLTGIEKSPFIVELGDISDLKAKKATAQIAAMLRSAANTMNTHSRLSECILVIKHENNVVKVSLPTFKGAKEAENFASANFTTLLNLPYLFIERMTDKATEIPPTTQLKDELLLHVASTFGWKAKTISLVEFQTVISRKMKTFTQAVKLQKIQALDAVTTENDRNIDRDYKAYRETVKKLTAPKTAGAVSA